MKNRFTPAAGPTPDPFVPEPQAVPAVIETAGDTLFPAQPADAPAGAKQAKAKDLLKQGTDALSAEMFKAGLSPQFIWALRMFLQFVLLKLRTPTTTPMLPHTPNADTKLVAAIEALLKGAPLIEEEEPRALKGVNRKEVAERKDLLVQYREIWKLLLMTAASVEAGITHLEQYLDGVARSVYPHVLDLVAGDRNAADLLDALIILVGEPAVQGQQTRKDKAKLTAQLTAQGDTGGVAAPMPAPVPAGTAPVATPTPAVPTSVVPAGAAHAAATTGSRAAFTTGAAIRNRASKRRK